LLSLAYPEEAFEALAALPVGERDGRLLDLREQWFGPVLRSVVDCPACGETLEFECPTASLRTGERVGPGALSLRMDDWHLTFRLPSTADVAAVAEFDPGNAVRALLARCLLEVDGEGATAGQDLPQTLVDALGARMGDADPAADIRMALSCPQCGRAWESNFDIAAYLWLEVEAWGRRTLEDVHRLASAYGWSESDILAMSGTRRQAYLELSGR
jgi:hypothetical protein